MFIVSEHADNEKNFKRCEKNTKQDKVRMFIPNFY